MTFATWSQTAASNTSVGGISTDGNVTLVNQIDNMFRGMMAELAVARDDGTIGATAGRGYLHGLTLSNNSGDATNDIDIAVGECATLNSPYWKMALASALTKRLDAAWAVGSGNGGLDTGSIANTSYHVWLIQRSDTGVVDALFSTSATSPTMPANYDRKRRIGSIIRESGAIVTFRQTGDLFKRTTLGIISSTVTFASAVIGTGVPVGIVVCPILRVTSSVNAGTSTSTNFGDAAVGSANTQVQANFATAAQVTIVPSVFVTNTGGQIYASNTVSGAINSFAIDGLGWIDQRDRT